jgi:hypothetical protein
MENADLAPDPGVKSKKFNSTVNIEKWKKLNYSKATTKM